MVTLPIPVLVLDSVVIILGSMIWPIYVPWSSLLGQYWRAGTCTLLSTLIKFGEYFFKPLACMYANKEKVQRGYRYRELRQDAGQIAQCQNENKVHGVSEARCRIGCLGLLGLDEGQGA